MRSALRSLAVSMFLVTSAAPPAASKDNLQDLIARLDRAASAFKAMTAQVTYLNHTDVLGEDDTEKGAVTMQKVQDGEVRGRVDFTAPDAKTVTFEKRRFSIYYPKINTLQVYDLDKHGEQLDRFVMIGFGTSGTELARDYDMTIVASEVPKGQSVEAIRLQLVPKSGDAREYVKKLELWIPQQGDPYPVQEKISQPSGDYRLVTYSELKINPALKADVLQLKLPAGVKVEHPQK